MWRALLVITVLAIVGCGAQYQIPESPQELADKKMETVPGKAVIYIVQNPLGNYSASLAMDDGTQITTWPGTFYRWVTSPGTHNIHSAQGNLNATITLTVEPDKIYFVQQWVNGIRGSTTDANLQLIDAASGRPLVTQGRLCCPTK